MVRYTISGDEEILNSNVELYDEDKGVVVKPMSVMDLVKLLNLQDLMIKEVEGKREENTGGD